jgi:hypothetical protein
VNIIRLSKASLKLVEDKEITFPSLPLLVLEDGKKLSTVISIAFHFVELIFAKDLFVGSTKQEHIAVNVL